ncbi:Hypothetical predicted protein [Mytilus galloprovincialis]|uniref:Uncharacterized protein n=1 Tax=Mytilus galloprovincialis TaxID=29158 RepID=A0A8B6CMC2_MYTGA|nr:Hypothetical predicted protein [Mytilus galloprovincialis]
MSVWVGSHGVRYSAEFRNIIYEINPVYLPCVYKEMFENNATNTMRENEDTNEDAKTLIKEATNVKTTEKENVQKNRCSSAVLYQEPSENSKQDEFSGWKTCSTEHSATSVHCNTTQLEDCVKHRSHSASAKLNTLKSDSPSQTTQKAGKTKQLKDRFSFTRPGTNGGTSTLYQDRKSTDQQKTTQSNYTTPGYTSRPTSPIQYKFVHFEFSENYIEQYRQEYTMGKIEDLTMKTTSTCVCRRLPSTIVPSVPMMPMFCTTEPYSQDSIKLRVASSYHLDTQTSKTRHDAQKKKQTTPKFTQFSERQKIHQKQVCENKSPHFLLGHNGVLKMEYYNNPLVIDNTGTSSTSKSSGSCRSRPSIPYNACGHTHPNSASSQYPRVYHKK